MDTIEYKGKEYIVAYEHHRANVLVDGDIRMLAKGGMTEAYIKEDTPENKDKQDTRLVSEYAKCSSKDTYNKVLGRKIALARLQDRVSGKLDEREAKREELNKTKEELEKEYYRSVVECAIQK